MHRLTVPLLALLVATAGCTYFPDSPDRGPGSRAADYLTGGGVLLVEVDHSPGQAPTSKVRSAMKDELERITRKKVEFSVTGELPSKGGSYNWGAGELRSLHQEHQDEGERRGVVVMHALFLDGRHENQQARQAAGVAFAAGAFALFMGTIDDNTCPDGALTCVGEPEKSNAVRAVAIHEAGHLLGLVNLGLPMVKDHEDDDHPGHSTNRESVLWWEVELGFGLQNLFDRGAGIPWQFDADDIRDARALQEGGS